MSHNLVHGFSDVMSRYNLIANGNFLINQRGLFTTYTQCYDDDFIADMWRIAFESGYYPDYVEGLHDVNGRVLFRGIGKKGQYVFLYQNELESYGYSSVMFDSANYVPFTSAATVHNLGKTSLSIYTQPKYNNTSQLDMFQTPTLLKNGKIKDFVRVMKTYVIGPNYRSAIKVTLAEDGPFEFAIYNFRLFQGAYKNPTDGAYVHPADDIIRCERYYQTGQYIGDVYVPFRTRMAGTPSVISTSGSPSGSSDIGFVMASSSGTYTWIAEI